MIYPSLVVIVGAITVFVMVAFFIPRIVPLFQDRVALPLPTKILVKTSEFMSKFWYWILIGIGLLLGIMKRSVASGMGRLLSDKMKLHLPLLRGFARQADMARFARTLSLLIESGITIDRALALSGNTLRNRILREEIEQVRRNTIQKGFRLASGLRETTYFPVFVSNMVAVGEESGRLDEVLAEVA